MDRIGVIKEAMRLENRKVFLFAPVPFWRKYSKQLAFFGLLLLVVSSSVFAVTIPADRGGVSFSVNTNCVPGNFSYSGLESGLKASFENFHNSGSCGTTVASLAPSSLSISWLFQSSGITGSGSYTATGSYYCPAGYVLVAVRDSGVSANCELSSTSTTLTNSQLAAVDWVVANQSALQNLLNNQVEEFDTVAAGAFWAFGFAGVMILYFTSHVIGLVLKAVKNG